MRFRFLKKFVLSRLLYKLKKKSHRGYTHINRIRDAYK